MADKSFGVKQLDVLGTGTPTISAPNILNLDCHTVAISTSITIGENLTVSGNVDLGNASSDTISLTGVVDTNIIPSADGSKDIGSNSVRFANGYFDTVYGSGANLTNLPTIAGIWTVTNNSASNYVISGPGGLSSANNPDLYLERGKTYQFAMNASGHGFGIQTSSGTWNNSNAYTTGITNAGADTGTITFAVPYSAPARLYYACTSSHSGMVGNLYIQGAASTVDVSNNADNRVITGGSGGSLNGESSLTFDGTTLGLTGNQTVSGTVQVAGNSNFGAASASPSPSALTVKMATNKHIGFSPTQSEVGNVPALVAFQDNGSLASMGFRGTDVRFAAGSTEVLRIADNGKVGINRTNPSSLLHLQTTDTTTYNISTAQTNGILTLGAQNGGAAGRCVGLQFNGTASNGEAFITLVSESTTEANLHFGMRSGGSRGDRMRISRGGDIGAPSGNNIYNASDERLKENMIELTDGLSKIEKLKPISFNWKDGWNKSLDGITQYGFGAQTTQVVDEKLVEPFGTGDVELNGETIENPLRVNEKYIIPLLVKAVQELSAKVAALEGS